MITKTFICDKCKKSVGENELIPVSTTVELPPKTGASYRRNVTCKKEFCKDCLAKQGIVAECSGDREEEVSAGIKNAKTLEDKLIDILEDLGVAFQE